MKRRILTVLFGLIISTVALPLVTASKVQAQPAHQPDPVVGPHARDEARHAGQPLSLQPASGQPSLRLAPLSDAPRALKSAGGRLSREVFGFAPYWELSNESGWNYSLLSTVAYFGISINPDGSFNTTDSGWTAWNSQNLNDMINRAHSSGDRVLLVIKAFDEATINSIVSSPTASQNAINNTLAAIASKSLDGVNVDFEGGVNPTYPNIQSDFTNFVSRLTTQLHQHWVGAVASVDTYSGSASWDSGFFNISALAPVTDAIFVMAYDMSFSNTPGQASPNAPLNGWTYNDTSTVSQYLAKAPASKIILGVPYYGYKWSTASNQPYASTSGGGTADTYSLVAGDLACAQKLTTAWDTTGQSPWASWWSPAVNDPCGGNHNSWRELYYDNAESLGQKYDLVNANNLRGAGMWALGFDSGSNDLWHELELKFVYPFKGMYTLDGFGGVSADGGSLPQNISAYWSGWKVARSAALLPDATGGYVLDAFGGLHAFGQAVPVGVSSYWSGWDIARDVVLLPSSTMAQAQGYVLEGMGGLHAFGGAPPARITGYWNFDIAKRAVMLSDGTGGYVLDGYGALHAFAVGNNAMPPNISNSAYWTGWNIARSVALVPGATAATVAGVTLDGFGGVHPFGSAAAPANTAYWRNWDIARSVQLSPTSTAAQPQGWVLDGYGGIHAFGGATVLTGEPYWANWDIAVQLLLK